MSRTRILPRVLNVLLLGSSLATAQVCTPEAFPHPLLPPGAAFGADFGAAVAVLGDVAVVGAPASNGGKGAAYVYRLIAGDWQKTSDITVTNGKVTDLFGSAVATDGARVYVGAPGAAGHDTSDGATYVYKKTLVLGTELWLLETKLWAADGESTDEFGKALAVDNGVLVVGASRDSVVNNSHIGAVCVFERINNLWTQTVKIGPPAPVLQGEHFGESLAMEGNLVLAGSPNHGGPAPFPSANGRATLLQRVSTYNWTVVTQFNPAAYSTFRRCGSAVAISGTRILVGASGAEDDFGNYSGAGFIYDKPFGAANWSFTAELSYDHYDAFGEFGSGVALTLNQAWIAGAKRILRFDFDNGAWQAASDPVAPFEGLISDQESIPLGPVVAADSGNVFVGRPGYAGSDLEAVFPMFACGGKWNVLAGSSSGTGGKKPRLRGAGALQDDLVVELRLVQGKASAPALFLLHGGAAGAGVPYAGGTIYAMPVNLAVALPLSAQGELTLPAVLPPGLASVKFVAQVLVGDSSAKHGVALSNGLEFEVGI